MSTFNYAGIKELAKRLCRPASTLIALAHANDPFYIGPARTAGAEWFSETWRRLDVPNGWHYRRIHYVFISQDSNAAVVMLDGKPYENTIECWDALCAAARDAITLDLLPQDAFADHRNAKPIIHLVEPYDMAVDVIHAGPGVGFRLQMPAPPKLTFDSPVVPQPYHVEIWAEKTTVNDILEPRAQQYQFNLVTGIGELSATRCREFVDRAERSWPRPVRVLYISDFDPAGRSMPVAVARKIEFQLRRRSLDLDVQLRPIVLTPEQCGEHKLPRTPIKETERRRERFEARFGEGATELDALEALHPGLLRRIVLREIRRYWNRDHDDGVLETCSRIKEQLAEITDAAHDEHRDDIGALKGDWQRIVEEIEAWSAHAEPVWQSGSKYAGRELPRVR